MLVDSEDDDEEEKGEEDAVSGSKYELVNGSSAPAAYLSCLAGGEPCCPLWGRSCRAVGFWGAAAGREEPQFSPPWHSLRRCCSVGDDGEQHGEVPLRKTQGEEARGEEARGT